MDYQELTTTLRFVIPAMEKAADNPTPLALSVLKEWAGQLREQLSKPKKV